MPEKESYYDKLERLAKEHPRMKSIEKFFPGWASSFAPPSMAGPFYRIEIPYQARVGSTFKYKWGGPWAVRGLNKLPKEVEHAISRLGARLSIPEGKDIPWDVEKHARYMFTEDVAKDVLPSIMEAVKKYPDDLRLLKAPDTIKKYALYEDPDQILVNIRKLLKKAEVMK